MSIRRFGLRTLVPLLGAIPLTGAIAGASFALQSSLNLPPRGATLAAATVVHLESFRTLSTVETLSGAGRFDARCTTKYHSDHLYIGGRLRAVIRGTRFLNWTGQGADPSSTLLAESELAGCPGFLVDELSQRLALGNPAFRRRTLLPGGRPGFILRIHGPDPLVELTLVRRTLQPVRVHLVTPHFNGYAQVVRTTSRIPAKPTGPPPPPATATQFLSLAESGLVKIHNAFWNPKFRWYDSRASKRWHPTKPLAHLWSAFPLFEALDAVAIADPSPAHKAAVAAFATGAERYFNPNLKPVGGYAYYPGTTNPVEHTFFDDNGWWEMSYLDAYRATGSKRDLLDAERAFRFIAVSGWDPVSGGTWWETLHLHKTSEPLAAEIYTGLGLYQITHDRSYYETAMRFLTWANQNSWNSAKHLYSRNPTDGTVLDYVEGMMIGAQLELCLIHHTPAPCTGAERLATASKAVFPRYADWTPAADVVYLRFLLDLYREDGNPVWYRLAYDDARRAYRLARSDDGFYFKRWNGTRFPTKLLQPDAATLSLFAWLGGTKAP